MSDHQEQIKNEFMEMAAEIARNIDARIKESWAEGYKNGVRRTCCCCRGLGDVQPPNSTPPPVVPLPITDPGIWPWHIPAKRMSNEPPLRWSFWRRHPTRVQADHDHLGEQQ